MFPPVAGWTPQTCAVSGNLLWKIPREARRAWKLDSVMVPVSARLAPQGYISLFCLSLSPSLSTLCLFLSYESVYSLRVSRLWLILSVNSFPGPTSFSCFEYKCVSVWESVRGFPLPQLAFGPWTLGFLLHLYIACTLVTCKWTALLDLILSAPESSLTRDRQYNLWTPKCPPCCCFVEKLAPVSLWVGFISMMAYLCCWREMAPYYLVTVWLLLRW